MSETIRLLVLESIEEINRDLNQEDLYAPRLETKFFELVDSLAVLNFILDIEERLEGQFGTYIQIGNEDVMDEAKTPFGTVKDIIEFISHRIKSEGLLESPELTCESH